MPTGARFASTATRFPVRGRRLLVYAGALLCANAMSMAAAQQPAGPVTVQPGAPGQASRTLQAETQAPAPQRSQADVDFMQGMIMHHGQAVEMTALIPSHTTDPQVRALGAKINSAQSDEMLFMKRWLRARGESTEMKMPEAMPGMPDMTMSGAPIPTMPGMLTPRQMEALRAAHGAEFDRLFLSGMIQHHRGALVMVDDLFKAPGAGQDADLFNFATDVDNTQRAEIRIMERMLKQETPGNGTKSPSGS